MLYNDHSLINDYNYWSAKKYLYKITTVSEFVQQIDIHTRYQEILE